MDSNLDQQTSWLSLLAAPGLGPIGARRLAAAVGGPRELLSTPLTELAELGAGPGVLRALSDIPKRSVDAALEWREAEPDRHLVCIDQDSYPELLRQVADAPVVLFVQGPVAALSMPQLAVVGARNPTRGGLDTAAAFAEALASAGVTITSGLARGIDGAAHRGALRAGAATIAVLGHGPDRVYPSEHHQLALDMLQAQGALVSEFLPGVAPERGNFPRRNRVISGLCRGVLVVEAAVRSGSLGTARSALEQGREVFAIPGSIHNPMARGCHRLIRDGAKLVETTDDVLSELNLAPQAHCEDEGNSPSDLVSAEGDFDDDYVTVLNALGHDPASVDVLVRRTGLTAPALSSMLLNLELKGLVSPVPGGYYVRRQEGFK